jgi:hypothetical protein
VTNLWIAQARLWRARPSRVIAKTLLDAGFVGFGSIKVFTKDIDNPETKVQKFLTLRGQSAPKLGNECRLQKHRSQHCATSPISVPRLSSGEGVELKGEFVPRWPIAYPMCGSARLAMVPRVWSVWFAYLLT